MRKSGFVLLALLVMAGCVVAEKPDMNKRCKELQELRFGMFVCWSFSTFSGYEWSPGVEDISFFNPTGFDPDQWCRTMKEAEMGYILFLTKHHDGFCLWDTKTTDRKVTNSPLGVDVLAEVKKACDKYGIKVALYFSEGDWSWSGRKDIHTSVARPDIKKAQLKELLTQYGPIEYIWFDHAVGDGGLSHEETAKFVKSIQPACFVGFNHGDQKGADIRLGERGKPGPLSDNSAETIGGAGRAKYFQGKNSFYLAEFTYPMLEGQGRSKMRGAQWFYSLPENDNFACSAEKIYEDYLGAKKYGNIFSLDVGPDRSGRIRKIDVETLQKVGRYIRGEIKLPPMPYKIKSAQASSTWDDGYLPEFAIDGSPSSRWGAKEGSRSGWIELTLEKPSKVSRIFVDEGTWGRTEQYEIKAKVDGGWQTVNKGTAIGANKYIKFSPVTTGAIRIEIIKANEVPTIIEIKLFEK